jgi:hypothetical protein
MKKVYIVSIIVVFQTLYSFLFSQSTVCLGTDAVVCPGQSITINDCGGIGGGGGGNTAPYTVASIPYSPDPFNVGTAINLSDDAVSSIQNIGFTFCFFGVSYT